MALRRRQNQMITNGASNYKIDYVAEIVDILYLKGYKNCIIYAKVTEI